LFDTHFKQTIITLNLSYNKIGDEGVKHLTNALLMNTVKYTALTVHLYYILCATQALQQLNLQHNYIWNVGAEHLTNLIQNKPVCLIVEFL